MSQSNTLASRGTSSQPKLRASTPTTGCRYTKHIRSGFTLIELIAVMSIVSILLVLAAPSIVEAMKAAKLTSAGDQLSFKISTARQISLSENKPVELRFFSWGAEGDHSCRAYQLFQHSPNIHDSTPLENPTMLDDDSVVIALTDLSPSLQAANLGSGWPKAASLGIFKTIGATYTSIVFFPDGSTNLTLRLKKAHLTVLYRTQCNATEAAPPSNYYTIQIDPVTATTTAYRP